MRCSDMHWQIWDIESGEANRQFSVRKGSFSAPGSGPGQALAVLIFGLCCAACRNSRLRAVSPRFSGQNEKSLSFGSRNPNRKLQVAHPVFPKGAMPTIGSSFLL
jgi:hypothetical protein